MLGESTMATMGLRVSVAFVLVLMCANGARADNNPLAKPSDVRAVEHLTTGNRHYRVREFDRAIEEFKAGSLVEDAPVFLYNLGQAYRQLGKYEDAIWHYERFLARARPTGPLKEAVEEFIRTMRDELSKAATRREPVEPAPPPTSPEVHAASAPNVGRGTDASSREVTVAGGLSTRRKVAIGAGVGGLAVAAVGVVLGVRARGFEEDAHTLCPMEACDRADEANSLLERGQTSALTANIAFGIGAAAIVGATVLWFTGAGT